MAYKFTRICPVSFLRSGLLLLCDDSNSFMICCYIKRSQYFLPIGDSAALAEAMSDAETLQSFTELFHKANE